MQPFGEHYLYEFFPEENILHVDHREVRLRSAEDVAAMMAEFHSLLDQIGRCWVVLCFDGLDFGAVGAEEVVKPAPAVLARVHGVVRYTSGRSRMDKRYLILSKYNRQGIQTNLVPSREQAFAEIRKQIALRA